jgi:hypothetical protein
MEKSYNPSSTCITEVKGSYLIDWSKRFSMKSSRNAMYIQGYIDIDEIKVEVDKIAKQCNSRAMFERRKRSNYSLFWHSFEQRPIDKLLSQTITFDSVGNPLYLLVKIVHAD